jgi:hypothetical protein
LTRVQNAYILTPEAFHELAPRIKFNKVYHLKTCIRLKLNCRVEGREIETGVHGPDEVSVERYVHGVLFAKGWLGLKEDFDDPTRERSLGLVLFFKKCNFRLSR